LRNLMPLIGALGRAAPGFSEYNQTQKRGKNGQIGQRPRPESEHLRNYAAHLQIVTDDLWRAAHDQLGARRARYPGRSGGWGPGARGTYLLTGMGRCGQRGGGIEVQTRSHGKKRVPFYTCARSYRSGPEVCSNRLSIRAEVADTAVVGMIADSVLTEAVLAQAVQEAVQAVMNTAEDHNTTTEIERLRQEVSRLVGALAGGASVANRG
jgi:hypothetical protein